MGLPFLERLTSKVSSPYLQWLWELTSLQQTLTGPPAMVCRLLRWSRGSVISRTPTMLARAGKEISRLLYVNDLTSRLTF